MPLTFFRQSIISSDNPYTACKQGIAEHPHYLDCPNCANAPWCEIADIKTAQSLSRQALTEANSVSHKNA